VEKVLIPVALRPVRPEETAPLRDMAERIWWSVYPEILSEAQIRHMLDWMYDPVRLEEEIKSGAAEYRWWVLPESGAEVGYLAFGPGSGPGEAHLHKFYLLPEWHGRGLGTAAWRALAAGLAGRGVDRVSLRVNRRNGRAIRCYLRNGFRIERDLVTEIGGGFVMDDHWMARAL
jgi:ribosomal protein S18 acetylase RimI-like enzyme